MEIIGGLALKNTKTRRYQKDEYGALEYKMFYILQSTFKEFSSPRYFASKESFGDMDILLSLEGFKGDMREYIVETFKPNEIFHNGHAWSFDYHELQIDFITCQKEDYDAYVHYFAFNDLGNFIGRIAQSNGLKYGQEGLWYNHYHEGQKVGRIPVSKDYPKIFAFLGLDYNKWVKGFNSLEEIFEYVIQSKYFDSKMYEMQNLNKINRDRNLKRASYMSFLAYIAKNCPDVHYEFPSKADRLKLVIEEFPEANIQQEIRRIEYEAAKSLYETSKFNGHRVMEKYGLKGKELGKAMKDFKDMIASEFEEDYGDLIIKMDEETIFGLFEASMNK